METCLRCLCEILSSDVVEKLSNGSRHTNQDDCFKAQHRTFSKREEPLDRPQYNFYFEPDSAIIKIFKERTRQINQENHTLEQDDKCIHGTLAQAAAIYAMQPANRLMLADSKIPIQWPFRNETWKPSLENRLKELVKAGALIVAEIERLQRAKGK